MVVLRLWKRLQDTLHAWRSYDSETKNATAPELMEVIAGSGAPDQPRCTFVVSEGRKPNVVLFDSLQAELDRWKAEPRADIKLAMAITFIDRILPHLIRGDVTFRDTASGDVMLWEP